MKEYKNTTCTLTRSPNGFLWSKRPYTGSRASTPLTARPSHNGGHHHARPQRRVPTSRTPSSILLKMLRGGFAPSGYRPSNDQPIEFGALHVPFDMPLTIADLVRNAHQESSRFPMTRTAPRFTPATSAQRTIELGQDVT